MERQGAYNVASSTPEVRELLRQNPDESRAVGSWYVTPNLDPITTRISSRELITTGSVDAYELLKPFLGNPILKGSLRTMDVLNGCSRQCDTCCVASTLPSRIFTYASLERLFSDKRFIEMLQPSLRIGSTGDVLDHPEAVRLSKMILDKFPGNEFKIFTNYRPKDEEKLDGLIRLARTNGSRMHLTISLPFNRNDAVNKMFREYAKKRPATFVIDDEEIGENSCVKNITIMDVRRLSPFIVGRVLSSNLGQGRERVIQENEARYSTVDFEHRGSSKTYLNPDALWLMVYGTIYESSSCRTYTPLNAENIELLGQLPFCSDFPTPENWPGGGFRRPYREAVELMDVAAKSGRKRKPLIIIEDQAREIK